MLSQHFFVFIQFFLSNVSWFSQFSSTGCLTHTDSRPLVHFQQHVQDGRKESLDGFVTTFSKMLPPHGNGGMFALDCEMVSSTGFCLLENNVVSAELSHHSFCGRFFFCVIQFNRSKMMYYFYCCFVIVWCFSSTGIFILKVSLTWFSVTQNKAWSWPG